MSLPSETETETDLNPEDEDRTNAITNANANTNASASASASASTIHRTIEVRSGGNMPGSTGSSSCPVTDDDDLLDRDGEIMLVPDDVQLAEFKSQVRMYIEMDNAIKKLQTMLKDRRAYKQQLADRMVKFMIRFNIEDLDTPDGSISSRVSYTKAPLSHKHIRDSIASYFARQNIPDIGLQLTDAVFNDRQRIEQVRLQRRRR